MIEVQILLCIIISDSRTDRLPVRGDRHSQTKSNESVFAATQLLDTTNMNSPSSLLLLAALIISQYAQIISAFVSPSPRTIDTSPSRSFTPNHQTTSIWPSSHNPSPLDTQDHHPSPPHFRHHPKSTRLHSFFGLGPAELLIIAVAGLFVIGPSKLSSLSKDAGSIAGGAASGFKEELKELKNIPEEFQKGLEEGEINARSRKAKDMEVVDDE